MNALLRRNGCKSKLADVIISHFPKHTSYAEPFFGTGSIFFRKPKAKFNFLNDKDSDVSNLFWCVMNHKDELEEKFRIMPIHQDLLEYWKKNKETEPILKALRFIFLSNFTYLGKMDCLRFQLSNPKKQFLKALDFTHKKLENCYFNNCDFERFFISVSLKKNSEVEGCFAYLDPPYLDTGNNYSKEEGCHNWTEQDVISLLDTVQKTGVKFAYSEFDHPFLINQAKERNLTVIWLGERKNLKNRRTEILIINYDVSQMKLF